ncbi:MAG TPA: hypothetical protein DEA63_04980, partial [Firmicutes bacterium]|nr:hypothetical protein [Bacillota bacterium]
ESGSGKSVTNKTIMGILPKSARIESGSILYEGEDLTKISEDEFHNIRGNKIGMIFQDPLSSLNPIMKIGKQITEEMIINGNHLKNYYSSLISEEFIAYKNDLRLKQLLEAERKAAKKDKSKPFDASSFAKRKEELCQKIKEDKIALAQKKKEARALVSEKKKDIASRHIGAVKKILSGQGSLKEKYDAFLLEHRRALGEKRVTHKEAKERALKIMAEVGIPDPERRFYQYPFEFSGGMRQRIVIAIALISEPDILICDEPTTALDVTIQAQILELINKLKKDHDMSVIFITHDLGVVANMADRVAVMYAGKICEYGTEKEIFFDPRHPYTWALLASVPDIDSKEKLEAIPGTPPDMIYPPEGDAFALRNRFALGVDFKYEPPFFQISPTHFVASWLEYQDAPEVIPPKIVTERIRRALKDEEALNHEKRKRK